MLTRPDVRYVRGYIVSVADQPSLNDMISKIVTSGRLDVIKFLNLRRELTLLTLGNSIDEVVIEYDCLQSPAQLSDTLLNNASVDTQISYGDLDSVGSEFTVYSSQRNYTQQEITELLVCDTLHIYESLPKVGILYSSRIGNWVEASKYVGSVFAACLGYTSDLDGPTTDDESSETVDIFTITSEISNL